MRVPAAVTAAVTRDMAQAKQGYTPERASQWRGNIASSNLGRAFRAVGSLMK